MTNRMHRRAALGVFALALTGLVAAAPSDGGVDPSQRIAAHVQQAVRASGRLAGRGHLRVRTRGAERRARSGAGVEPRPPLRLLHGLHGAGESTRAATPRRSPSVRRRQGRAAPDQGVVPDVRVHRAPVPVSVSPMAPWRAPTRGVRLPALRAREPGGLRLTRFASVRNGRDVLAQQVAAEVVGEVAPDRVDVVAVVLGVVVLDEERRPLDPVVVLLAALGLAGPRERDLLQPRLLQPAPCGRRRCRRP